MLKDPPHIDDLFAAALAEPAASRASFLDQLCGENFELRDRLTKLLAAHDAAGTFLELTAVEPATTYAALSERPGSIIGRYKLLEQIGEGGFGVVFLAEQEQPVRRRVALKVIKLGMETKQVVARFEAERQALAMMDHPNIAKVFDAGSTDTGRPYFVMELVRGVTFTAYCDDARLTTNERLVLFQVVCFAIQHAHQKGIIHRDLKPSNVLVTLHDDKAVPKVIDFGVAKATQARLTERTLFTEFRQIIGTPSYMSPEQAHISGLDVDTRSDVYSLGVLLYELLTGSTPIDAAQLNGISYDDLRQLICEVDPPSPSARLSTMTREALTTLAQRRQSDPGQLAVHLRSDLDWIVMKCLEKDRRRRYESPSGLAQDLQRYLAGEPVEARPPTRRYRLSKFVRRNKAAVFVVSSIAALLVAAATIIVVSNHRIRLESAAKEVALNEKDAALEEKGVALRDKEAALTDKDAALRLAKHNESIARGRYYAAQMNLASQALGNGQVARTAQLLETLRPGDGEPDLRRFEWYYLYQLTHAKVVNTWRAGTRAVLTIGWSPDGKLIATTDVEKGLLQLWDAKTGGLKGQIPTDRTSFWDIAFVNQGGLLAGGTESGEVVVWDVAAQRELRRWKTHPLGQTIRALAASTNSNLIATSSYNDDRQLPNATIELWNTEGELQTTLECQPQTNYAMKFSPDGSRIAAATSPWDAQKNLTIWKLSPRPERIGANRDVAGEDLVFSDDNKTLWLADDGFKPGNPSAHEIDVQSAAIRQTYTGHTAKVTALTLLQGGKKFVTAACDRTVRVWDVESGQSTVAAADLSYLAALARDPTSNRAVVGNRTGWLTLLDLDAPSATPTLHCDGVTFVDFTPDRQRLVVGGSPLKVLNSNLLEVQDTITAGKVLAATKDVNCLAIATEGGAKILDRATGKSAALMDAGSIDRAAFSPNGAYLATWLSNGTGRAKIWDVPTRVLLADLTGDRNAYHVAFAPDSSRIAVTRFEGFRIYDIEHKVWAANETVGKNMTLLTACYSPDGAVFAAGLGDGTAVLYDVDRSSGGVRYLAQLEGSTVSISAMTFSPDSQLLVTACCDQSVRIWDIPTKQERITLDLPLHQQANLLAFSPDGSRLAVVDNDNVVQLLVASKLPSAAAARSERTESDRDPVKLQRGN